MDFSSTSKIKHLKSIINENGKVVLNEKEQDDFWKLDSKRITLFEELLKILIIQ